jgi:hypothetical protein
MAVCGGNDGDSICSLGEQPEKQFCGDPGERHTAECIDNDEPYA